MKFQGSSGPSNSGGTFGATGPVFNLGGGKSDSLLIVGVIAVSLLSVYLITRKG